MTTYLQEEINLDDTPRELTVNVCNTMTRCLHPQDHPSLLHTFLTSLLPSHPSLLTERELEEVTAVFRSLESGLREATILPKVTRRSL